MVNLAALLEDEDVDVDEDDDMTEAGRLVEEADAGIPLGCLDCWDIIRAVCFCDRSGFRSCPTDGASELTTLTATVK